MTDDSEAPSKSNDDVLLDKVNAVLLRYRKESYAVIHPKERVSPFPISSKAVGRQADNKAALTGMMVPTLTKKCLLPSVNFPVESDISLLLSYAFDAALGEAQINLNPADRLALFQALSRRLPKNF